MPRALAIAPLSWPIASISSALGTSDPAADLNGNGVVDSLDLALVARDLGR